MNKKTIYHNPGLAKLIDQLSRFAPRDVVTAQMERAEALLREVGEHPERDYLYPEISERITGRPTELYPHLPVTGAEAFHDLRLIVEDLSKVCPSPLTTVRESVVLQDDVVKLYQVSWKTVRRWRDRGLPGRQIVVGQRRRIGFLKTTLDWYVQRFAKDVERGTRFTQLDDREKEAMVCAARRLALAGASQTDVARALARQFSRSHETVRYTLRKFDLAHPEVAVFPNALTPLTDTQKDDLYQQFLRGVAVPDLATRFNRTRTSVYRIVAEVRARNLLQQTIDFMDSAEFQDPEAEARILGPAPELPAAAPAKAPPGLPPYLASLYATPLLTKEAEAHHFRKMNYLKYRAFTLRGQLDVREPRVKDMEQIESWLERANEVKNFLIRCNLRLVVSVAKKHVKPSSHFFEMVSDGNMSLIKAIEKFDYSRGFKFSTYATWAIMKNFARSIPAESTQHDRFRTGNDEFFSSRTDYRGDQFREELTNLKQSEAIHEILGQLDQREREIIVARYGLEANAKPLTLEQVGVRLGVTKERIRQLETRALQKMRRIAEVAHLDVPGV